MSGCARGCAQTNAWISVLFFTDPVRFRGHLEEIGIAKVLLKTKPRRVGKFRDVGFRRLRKCGERKKEKLSAKYNDSLALATLEQATIIMHKNIESATG